MASEASVIPRFAFQCQGAIGPEELVDLWDTLLYNEIVVDPDFVAAAI
jgi:hypothetical protein